MRKLFVLVSILASGFLTSSIVRGQTVTPVQITLTCDYPDPSVMSVTNPMTFEYRFTNSAGLLTAPINWPVVKSVTLTNPTETVSSPLLVTPGEGYYACRVSNFWGWSDFSNVASTPPAPRSDVNFRISRP